MSAITIEDNLVHYEVLGRGRPVIFVHGWLGSWRLWMPTMQQLSTKYRTYALDLWGYGDSGKDSTFAKYTLDGQVTLLHDFMEKLGIPKAALVGHSFGAAVTLRYALKYPESAPRLMLISAPLVEGSGVEVQAPVTITSPSPVPVPAQPTTPIAPAVTGSTPVPAPQPLVQPAPVQPVAQQTPVPVTTPVQPVVQQPPTPVPTQPVPAPVQPAAQTPAPTSPAASPTPAVKPEVAPVPAQTQAVTIQTPQSGGTLPVPPATPAPTSGNASDTLPRNPLKGMGGSVEEILANAQRENIAKSSPIAPAPVQPTQASPAPVTPAPASAQPVPAPNNGTPAGSANTTVPVTPAAPSVPANSPNPAQPAAPVAPTAPQIGAAGTLLPNTIAKPITPPAAQQPPAQPPVQPTAPAPVVPTRPAPLPPQSSRSNAPVNAITAKFAGAKPLALFTRFIDRDSSDPYKMRAEIEKTDEAALTRGALSFNGVNIVAELQRLTAPTLLLHGKDDPLLDAPSNELLEAINRNKAKGQFLPIVEEDLKHFPMLEINQKFNRLLMDFLDATDLVNIQFKDQWKRTLR